MNAQYKCITFFYYKTDENLKESKRMKNKNMGHQCKAMKAHLLPPSLFLEESQLNKNFTRALGLSSSLTYQLFGHVLFFQ